MAKRKKGEKVLTSIYLDKELKIQLEKLAEKEERSMAWLINHFIREGLERRKK